MGYEHRQLRCCSTVQVFRLGQCAAEGTTNRAIIFPQSRPLRLGTSVQIALAFTSPVRFVTATPYGLYRQGVGVPSFFPACSYAPLLVSVCSGGSGLRAARHRGKVSGSCHLPTLEPTMVYDTAVIAPPLIRIGLGLTA